MPSYEFMKSNSGKVMPYIENGRCVVLHHMNGCIHCQMFMPVWKKVCQFYSNKNDYMIVTVEYSDMELLPQSMKDVQGFPTLRAYKNTDAVEDFNDNRTYEAVKEFIEKYGKNPVSSKSSSSASASSAQKAKAKAKAKPAPSQKSMTSSSMGEKEKKVKKEKK